MSVRSHAMAKGDATKSSSWNPTAMRVLLFVVALIAYWPALNGELLWDDIGHVTRPDLQSLSGLARIWTEVGATQQYYPLLHSAFWLEHKLWGDATLGYHLVNVLLHATAACLFAAVLRRLFASRQDDTYSNAEWIAAFLFVLHPVCVESVAWISEQKNTLSLVLYLCAALTYLRFDNSAGDAPPPARPSELGKGGAAPTRPRSTRAYWLATAIFFLALCTKTVTATLPAALLMIFWWQRRRLDWRRDVFPLLPWFALSLAGGLTTAWFERTLIGADGSSFTLSIFERGLLAGRVIWFYVSKLLLPVQLSFIYPRWTVDVGALWQFLFPLAVFAALGALWFKHQRGLLAAFLFFCGSLFPALGFVNVFPFIFSWVADHFQYLACLGLLAPIAVGLSRLPRAVPIGVLAVLGALTWRQSAMYQNPFTLFETTLEKNPDCWMAHNNLAEALTNAGRPADAIPHLEQALKLRPGFAEAENNLGDDLRRLGRAAEAVPHLEKALRLQPNYAQAHSNLGVVLMQLNRSAEGIAHFEEAIRLQPTFAVAHLNLGLALATSGRTAEAIARFERALKLDPDYADAELNWAIGLTLTGRPTEAFAHFERALRLDPNSVSAHTALARALSETGRYDEAVSHFQQALELAPTAADIHLFFAQTLQQMGRTQEANTHFAEAQRLRGAVPPSPR